MSCRAPELVEQGVPACRAGRPSLSCGAPKPDRGAPPSHRLARPSLSCMTSELVVQVVRACRTWRPGLTREPQPYLWGARVCRAGCPSMSCMASERVVSKKSCPSLSCRTPASSCPSAQKPDEDVGLSASEEVLILRVFAVAARWALGRPSPAASLSNRCATAGCRPRLRRWLACFRLF